MRFVIIALFALSPLASYHLEARKSLGRYATIQSLEIRESSGLLKSPRHENLYWTHNDSGDSSRLFAIRRDGSSIIPKGKSDKDPSILIRNAAHVDWEDCAFDRAGRLYIGDFGNNSKTRADLALYILEEPDPARSNRVKSAKKIRFAYPGQGKPTADSNNFNCEALFIIDQTPYVLTKEQFKARTTLFRFDTTDTNRVNILTPVGEFNIGGAVTGSDISPDQSLLAVITYNAIWIFEKPSDSDNFLLNPVRKLRIKAKQCEAICWDNDNTLIIANEQADLFEIALSDIPAYEPR